VQPAYICASHNLTAPYLNNTVPLCNTAVQTGPKGKPVNTLYVANKMKLKREMYFAILLDRKSAGPVMIGCSEVSGPGQR
jgi:succinyl-CoA synthetase beta subunit